MSRSPWRDLLEMLASDPADALEEFEEITEGGDEDEHYEAATDLLTERSVLTYVDWKDWPDEVFEALSGLVSTDTQMRPLPDTPKG